MMSISRTLGLLLASVSVSCAVRPSAPATVPAAPAFGKARGNPNPKTWFSTPRQSEVVAVEAGVAGDRVAALVDVPRASCAIFIARGTGSIEDLDLAAYGEDGAVLGLDEGPDKTPALLVCPPHPTRVYASARIAAGHGLVALGVERVDPKDAERAADEYHARHRKGEADARLSAFPGLAERLAEHRAQLGGKWQDVRRVALPLDARIPTRLSATIEENRCLNALVLPTEELSHLEFSAFDASGQLVGRALALGRDRSLVVCSASAAGISLELRPHGGRGLAVVVLSQSEPGTATQFDDAVHVDLFPTGTLDEVREKNAARLQGLGYPNAKVVKTGVLPLGKLDSASFELPKGCARLDVLAAAPVRGVAARLWSADDSLIAESEGRASPVIFACSSQAARVRLDSESLVTPGAYSVEVRAETDAPAPLTAYPLAASRLLDHLLARGFIRSAAEAGKIVHHALSPDHLEHEDFIVPLDRCVDFTLAVGSGATGAEVRIVDRDSGAELNRARGTHTVNAEVCAVDHAGGTINARAELRVAAGHGDALSAMRSSTPAR